MQHRFDSCSSSSSDEPDFYKMRKGETFVLLLQIKNADGSPKDLSGATLYFTLKNFYNELDSNAIAQLSSPSDGIQITNPSIGAATVTLPPIYTSRLVGDGPILTVFDVKCIDPFGIESIPESAKLLIKPAASRVI